MRPATLATIRQTRRELSFAAEAGFAGVGHYGLDREQKPSEVIMAAKRPDFRRLWAIVDSNHGPPPYQSGALTN